MIDIEPITTIIPENPAVQVQQHELPRQQEVSQSFTKLKATLEARLRKISESTPPQTQPQEQISASEPQEQSSTLTESQPEEQKKPRPKEAVCAEALLKILRTQNLSELNGSNFDLIVNFGTQDKQDLKSVRITIVDGKINISGVVGEDGTVASLSEGQKIRGLDEENKHLDILTEHLVKTVFPNLSPQEHQALTSTILGQEPRQIEDLAHSLGYLTRYDLGEILGIPKDKTQRDKLLDNISDPKLKKAIEKAANQIYGSEENPPAIAEIPEAGEVSDVLKGYFDLKSIDFSEITRTLTNKAEKLSKKDETRSQGQAIEKLVTYIKSAFGKNLNLETWLENYYQSLAEGNEPVNIASQLSELTPALNQIKNISKEQIEVIENRIKTTGKITGIFAIILALMIFRSAQSESKGQGGLH
jgi:hypothetical protein